MKIDAITPNIGAEISDISLNKGLNNDIGDQIYNALIKYQVIFFRDQELTPDTHMQLAETFGDPEPPHPIYPHVDGHDKIVLLKNDEDAPPDTNDWHKDMTFRTNPPFASILYAVSVPNAGGDTLWSSMSAAYSKLHDIMKEQLDGLEAINDMGSFRNNYYSTGGIDSVNNALKSVGSAVHKVIETHPISGLKYINVNQSFTRNIIGESQGESDHILQFLYHHIYKPEFQVRFRWRNHSVAIWDNRITQHYAVADYLPNNRHMHRVTVINDKKAL